MSLQFHPRFRKNGNSKRYLLVGINENYEMWHDTILSLDCAVLKPKSLRVIAGHHEKRLGIKIEIFETNVDDDVTEDEIYKRLESMNSGEFMGLICVKFSSDEINGFRVIQHISPLIIAKDQEGIGFVVEFEGDDALERKSLLYIKKFVPEYKTMQKDVTSCGLFSVEVLKDSMSSDDFMARVFSANSTILELRTMSLAQGRENKKYLDEETIIIYVDQRDDRNYKANYLSHRLLLDIVLSGDEITSYHESLHRLTKAMISEIDVCRGKLTKVSADNLAQQVIDDQKLQH
jgi:hypothetical protein